MSMHDATFDAMGGEVRVMIGDPAPGWPDPSSAASKARLFIAEFEAALSRFRPESELCALNADPRAQVPASALLRTAVSAGIWAAQRSNGLVDPTLLGALERVGYERSRAGVPPASLAEAVAAAPARAPARPHPAQAWRQMEVDHDAGIIRRPPGLGFDTGGTGKGLAADLLAQRLRGYSHLVIDCGGDIRVGGFLAVVRPLEVQVEHPLSGEIFHTLSMSAGGVATSGLNVRLWRTERGHAHHLLDPSTGEPAWTGLVGVTALGASALEAEVLSKAALLSGPDGARRILSRRGGLFVHDDGEVEFAGPLEHRQTPAPPARAAEPIR